MQFFKVFRGTWDKVCRNWNLSSFSSWLLVFGFAVIAKVLPM